MRVGRDAGTGSVTRCIPLLQSPGIDLEPFALRAFDDRGVGSPPAGLLGLEIPING